MSEHAVGTTDELDPGSRILTHLEGRQIVVFNVDGEYHAYTNWCPHQGGPVCEGLVTGTTSASFDREELETTLTWERDGEVLTCPWHAWEFELTSGDCLSRGKIRLLKHDVRVEDDEIIVSV